MVVSIGDLHLRADHPWFRDTAESFLSFFGEWDLNNKDNTLVLLGDLVDKSKNGGIVIEYLERLASTSRFKEMIIVAGNHDFKRINEIFQLAYNFLKHKSHISIYTQLTRRSIEGVDCLILPYLTPTSKMPNPSEYYSNLHKTITKPADVVFGHIQDDKFPGEGVSNLNKLAQSICLGHIHTRFNDKYLGSMCPQNYSENGQRYTRTYSRKTGTLEVKEVELPTFLDFKVIEYGDDVAKDNALNSVYVIHNCPPDHLLDSKYKGLYIRKKVRAATKKADVAKSSGKKNKKEYFNDFLKQSAVPLNRSTVKICREALNI